MLAFATVYSKFAADLVWLVKRSIQCATDGPQPLPPLGLTDADLGVEGARRRVERSTAQVAAKRSRQRHELFVLQSTLADLASLSHAWSNACKARAGSGKGRPRRKDKIEAEVRAAFNLAPRARARKRAAARTPHLNIPVETLNRAVLALQATKPGMTATAACDAIVTRAMWAEGRLQASWRESKKIAVVGKEVARACDRLFKWRTAQRKAGIER